jgi:hypothetical protein
MSRTAVAVVALLVAALPVLAVAREIPALTGPVVDVAGVLRVDEGQTRKPRGGHVMLGRGCERRPLMLGAVSALLLFSGPVVARAGEAASAGAAKPGDGQLKPIYHLSLTVRSCQARLLLNGFPLISKSAGSNLSESTAPPVNPYLAGKRNTVEIEIRPAVRDDGTEVPLTHADFEMDVREYHKGGIVEPGGGKLVTEFSMPPNVRKQLEKGKKLKLPLRFTHRFANGGGIDFSAELLDAPPFTDRKAVGVASTSRPNYSTRRRSRTGRRWPITPCTCEA